MTRHTRTGVVLFWLLQGLVGCSGSDIPSGPSPFEQRANPLIVFTDPRTGLPTSDVRDAQDHVVQFTAARELVWMADGTRLAGHVAHPSYLSSSDPGERSCQCWLVVRFGTSDGERRAYLTADYGHFNPGTLVALEVVGGALIVSRTDMYPPGRYTLSGVVTEVTETGVTPIENASVTRLNEEGSGWDEATTDRNGFYEMRGLTDSSVATAFNKAGYHTVHQVDPIHGDTRVDVQLIRR